MAVVAYIRVSTAHQDAENQRYEILKFADDRKLMVERWVIETVSGTKSYKDRELGELIQSLGKDDCLMITELSRLGRSLLEVMSILHQLMEQEVMVYSIKEKFELGNNVQSKVLAFAFSLSAEIERQLISQRTREALARKKAMGITLGRPRGSRGKSKLDGQEEHIRELLAKGVSKASIGKMLGVHPTTITQFATTRELLPKEPAKP